MPWISDEYQKLDRSPRALQRFGLTIGSVLLLLGGILAWRHRDASWPLVSIGTVLMLAATFAPVTLNIVHGPWMILSVALGWVVTRIILTIVFFFVVTPIGLLQRLCGKRAIEIDFRTGAVSYWRPRPAHPMPADYEKQF
ncbi:MAG: SxtJ family membrane protein [Verrucomicrobiota bacterium]|nr:SxtJ family membrane protein [Verrucomicrobiota bacterium]